MDTNDLISITDAARKLGLSRGSLYDAIERGDIKAHSIAGKKLLSRTQVEAYKPRAYVGKRENQRSPGEKGPSRWGRV